MSVGVLLYFASLLRKAAPAGGNTNLKLIVDKNFLFISYFLKNIVSLFYFLSFLSLLCLFFKILDEMWDETLCWCILLCGFDFNATLQNHLCLQEAHVELCRGNECIHVHVSLFLLHELEI